MNRRVVITGMGVVSPLGHDLDTLRQNVYAGTSGVRLLSSPYADQLNCRFAAEVDFNPDDFFESKSDYAFLDRIGQMALVASKAAVIHSGLSFPQHDERAGVYVGTGMGGALSVEEGYEALFVEHKKKLKPFTVLMCMYNGPASAIATHFGIAGHNYTYSTACSSSGAAFGSAFRDIRHGYIDKAIVCGTDAILSFASIKSWEAIRTLAKEDNQDFRASCKPFSANRSGLVIGEGAGSLVIESFEHAVSRGATILAEIMGYGTGNDAKHITIPSPEGQAIAMRNALVDSGLQSKRIQYINAHGTGTEFNDASETNAIKQVFGEHAYQLAVSSTKAIHGHLMGAANAIEAIITVLSLCDQRLPPTMHYDAPDPVCDLDYVVNAARDVMGYEYAMNNSFAFGGTGTSMIFKRTVA